MTTCGVHLSGPPSAQSVRCVSVGQCRENHGTTDTTQQHEGDKSNGGVECFLGAACGASGGDDDNNDVVVIVGFFWMDLGSLSRLSGVRVHSGSGYHTYF